MKDPTRHTIWIVAILGVWPALLACAGSGGGAGGAPTETQAAPAETSEAEASVPEVVTRPIGPGGGAITSADDVLEITIPTDALDGELVLAIEPVAEILPRHLGTLWSAVYDLRPVDVAFAAPIRVTITYDPESLISECTCQSLAIAAQTGEDWRGLPPSLDEEAHLVWADAEQASRFALVIIE